MTDQTTFASWRSYWDFAREVTHERRYLLSAASRAFLDELVRTSAKRQSKLPAAHRLCRAQVAHSEYDHPDAGLLPRPADPQRMIPLPNAASDGRANPRGIPCLYMADDRHTAIAEVRPWIGSLVSVAIMRTLKDQRLVDVRNDSNRTPIYLEDEPSPPEREAAVWSHVARAFREPVLREDDRAGYASTQIIAEAFRNHGYDGIAYGSAFGEGRTNIVLFDTAAAELEACELAEKLRCLPYLRHVRHRKHTVPLLFGLWLSDAFDRRHVDPVPAQREAEDRLDERQHSIGQHGPFQSVEEVSDVRATDVDDLAVPPSRQDVHLEAPLLEPPTVILRLGHLLDPVLGDGAEGPLDSIGTPAPRDRSDKLKCGSPRVRQVHTGIAAQLLVYGPPAGTSAEYPRLGAARSDPQAEARHLRVGVFLLPLRRRFQARHPRVR